MQSIGIIAEYNPFHNGHLYHIAQTKAQLPDADGIIAVMSGNFTQRGEPAIFDKWTRTQSALQGGADLVIELPTVFATRSAGYFARGAVLTLAATGIVSHLSCGIEELQDIPMQDTLQRIVSVLANEPELYRNLLCHYLEQGYAYPAARQAALEQYGVQEAMVLKTPNNILAFEYLQTIAQDHLTIAPLLIPRVGAYHDLSVPTEPNQYASATAIRHLIQEGNTLWKTTMPSSCAALLQSSMTAQVPPMQLENFAQILLFLLRRSTPQELQSIIDMSEGFENRIYEAAQQDVSSIADLCMKIKTKRFPYTRIQRTLLHILLQFTETYSTKEPSYIRVLGFNPTGQKLLKEMKKTAQLPILIRPARQQNLLSASGKQQFSLDVRATNLYYTGYHDPLLRKTNLDLLRTPLQYTYAEPSISEISD